MNKITIILASTIFSTSASAWNIPQSGNYVFENVNANVHVMHGPLGLPSVQNQGFMNNPAFIQGKNGITIVDPGSSYFAGKNIITEIEKTTKLPILAAFNSHVHGDHWLGNQAVAEKYPSVDIFAAPKMIERAKADQGEVWTDLVSTLTEGFTSDTVAVYPTKAVKHLQEIIVGSETFRIHAPLQPAHTNTDIMVEHVNSKTLFLGDNLLINRFGNFDSTSDMHNNLETLNYAIALNMTTYVPGHGPSGSAEDSVQPFADYIRIVKEDTMAGYEDDLVDYEIKPGTHEKLSKFYNWVDYDVQLGKHIGKMLREIESRDM